MYPYHYTKVQHLLPEDYTPRLEFCNWSHQKCYKTLETIYLDEQDCAGKLMVHNLNIYFENRPQMSHDLY
jgi:hypothetical protein